MAAKKSLRSKRRKSQIARIELSFLLRLSLITSPNKRIGTIRNCRSMVHVAMELE